MKPETRYLFEKETERLIDYVLSEDSERVARFARLLDCSAFSEKKNDCFFFLWRDRASGSQMLQLKNVSV